MIGRPVPTMIYVGRANDVSLDDHCRSTESHGGIVLNLILNLIHEYRTDSSNGWFFQMSVQVTVLARGGPGSLQCQINITPSKFFLTMQSNSQSEVSLNM